jgi:DNA-binding MarR family transcriptional regulator
VGGARTWKFSQKFVEEKAEQQRESELAGPSRREQYEAALASEPGLNPADIARRFGVSRAAVTQALGRK